MDCVRKEVEACDYIQMSRKNEMSSYRKSRRKETGSRINGSKLCKVSHVEDRVEVNKTCRGGFTGWGLT